MVETVLARMASLQILGRSPVGAYLRLNEWIWDRLPRSVTARRPVRSFGHLEAARRGVYPSGRSELVDEPIFDRMTAKEMEEMFDRNGDWLRVKPWIKEGIVWRVGDAADPGLAAALGHQDMVVANRFLCHMRPLEAEECLRNLARLVAPGGHLFVSGVDLDVRTKVATALGWKPVPDLLEEIHEGDPSLRASWPHRYWGLEPIDKGRADWIIRYASVFQLGASP